MIFTYTYAVTRVHMKVSFCDKNWKEDVFPWLLCVHFLFSGIWPFTVAQTVVSCLRSLGGIMYYLWGNWWEAVSSNGLQHMRFVSFISFCHLFPHWLWISNFLFPYTYVGKLLTLWSWRFSMQGICFITVVNIRSS